MAKKFFVECDEVNNTPSIIIRDQDGEVLAVASSITSLVIAIKSIDLNQLNYWALSCMGFATEAGFKTDGCAKQMFQKAFNIATA
jgi:hypothetical protein